MTGSRPPGSLSPNSTEASAAPNCWPGYQACSTASTWCSHGISTGPPVLSTTIVLRLTAATASMSWSWSPGSASVDAVHALALRVVGQDDRRVGVARRLDGRGDARGRRRLPREVDLRAEELRRARVVDADRHRLAGREADGGLHRVARAGEELDALAVAGPDAPAVDPQRRQAGLQQREAVEARLGRRERARPARRPQRPDARGRRGQVDGRVGPRQRGRAGEVAVVPVRRREPGRVAAARSSCSGTSPSEPCAAVTFTPDPARARIPASGVTVAPGAGVTADEPPLM